MQWTPDGRHVLFLQSRGDKGATLWRVPSAGGEAEELWQTKDQMTWFALSPDGSQAVYATVEGDSEVWVMENLKEALKANDGSESTRGTSTSRSGS